MPSKILSFLIERIAPGSHIRDIVNAEIFKTSVEAADPNGLLYAHSPTSFYCAHILAKGQPNRVHFIPLSPHILFHDQDAHFRGISKRSLRKALELMKPLKSSIRSIVTIDQHNAPMAKWWAGWYDVPDDCRHFVKAIWALSPKKLEQKTLHVGDRNRMGFPASFVIDARRFQKPQYGKMLASLARKHAALKVIGIVDNDAEIKTLTSLVEGLKDIELEIVDRRAIKRRVRQSYLLKGLFQTRTTHAFNTGPSTALIERQNINPIASEPDPTFSNLVTSHLPVRVHKHFSTVDKITEQIDFFSGNAGLFTAGMKFDMVLSFDVVSAPTGHLIAQACEAQHIIDFNETPIFEDRVGKVFKMLSANEMEALYEKCHIGVTKAKVCISSSASLAARAQKKFGTVVTPIRSFHNAIKMAPSETMRSDFNIPENAIVLLHCCTYAHDYKSDLLIDVMAYLPEHYHLVMVGQAANDDYDAHFKKRVKKFRLTKRVHFKGVISGIDNYLSYLSTADMGLVVLDNTVATVRDGLANRFVDILGAGLPVVSTHAEESSQMITTHDLGRVTKTLSPADIACDVTALNHQLGQNQTIIENVENARTTFTWDKEIEKFRDISGHKPGRKNQSACFVFQRGLRRNKRILRLASSLADIGWDVTVLSGVRPRETTQADFPKIKFHRVPTRHAWRGSDVQTELNYYNTDSDIRAAE